MLVAHGAEGSGSQAEYLVTAGALLALGILLFLQKSAPAAVIVVLVLVALALASGALLWGVS